MKKQLLATFIFFITTINLFAATPFGLSDDYIENLLKKMDKNGDRIITRDEVIEYSKNEFKKIAGSVSASIDRETFVKYVCEESCRENNFCSCKEAGGDTLFLENYFHRMDLDGDGKITLQEMISDNLGSFKNLDMNADGIFDTTDFESALQETESQK